MIFASNNYGKIKEIKEIFKDYTVYSLNEKNIDIDVIEDGESFYDNAIKKAKAIYDIAKEPVIADDSGLCITALNGLPGVLTHRYLGKDATDEERNINLINKVNSVSDKSAKVICSLVYYDGVNLLHSQGILCGNITEKPRGENGFGFDPIFELKDGKTLAELTEEEKNAISARHLAAVELLEKIKDLK